MLSRRLLLRRSLYSELGLSLNKGVPALGQIMASSPQVRSGVKLTRYVDPLVVPPVIHATGEPDEVLDIEMRQFQQKVHRDLPLTTLCGYNGSGPGPTIRAPNGPSPTVNLTHHRP